MMEEVVEGDWSGSVWRVRDGRESTGFLGPNRAIGERIAD